MQGFKSPLSLGEVTPNIGSMLLNNRDRYGDQNAFAERREGPYRYWSWQQMTSDILKIATFLLTQKGVSAESTEDTVDNRVAFISANGYHRMIS